MNSSQAIQNPCHVACAWLIMTYIGPPYNLSLLINHNNAMMILCSFCVAPDCDGISGELYSELALDEQLTYICSICQGKVPDRVDKYNSLK